MYKYITFIIITMAVSCKANSQPLINLAESLEHLNRVELKKSISPQKAASILGINLHDYQQKVAALPKKSITDMKRMEIKSKLGIAYMEQLFYSNTGGKTEKEIQEAYDTLYKFLDL